MLNHQSARDFDAVISDPAKYFQSPSEVLIDSDFRNDEKIKILEEWKIDLENLAIAADENMIGGESGALLGQVTSALNLLRPHTVDQYGS